MNQVYLGERAYGFAAAASVYFDKPLRSITLAEAAMLAGLPKAPSAYNPVANRPRAVVRQQHVLSRMLALGWVERAAYERARSEPLALRTARPAEIAAGYPVEQARKLVVEQFGDAAYTRGLDVTLTIDVEQQRAAMQALRAGLLRGQQQQGYAGPEDKVAVPATEDRAALRAALASYVDSGMLQAALVRKVSAAAVHASLRDGTMVTLARRTLPAGAVAALSPSAAPEPASKRARSSGSNRTHGRAGA